MNSISRVLRLQYPHWNVDASVIPILSSEWDRSRVDKSHGKFVHLREKRRTEKKWQGGGRDKESGKGGTKAEKNGDKQIRWRETTKWDGEDSRRKNRGETRARMPWSTKETGANEGSVKETVVEPETERRKKRAKGRAERSGKEGAKGEAKKARRGEERTPTQMRENTQTREQKPRSRSLGVDQYHTTTKSWRCSGDSPHTGPRSCVSFG